MMLIIFYMGLVFEHYFIYLANQLLLRASQLISKFKPFIVFQSCTFTYWCQQHCFYWKVLWLKCGLKVKWCDIASEVMTHGWWYRNVYVVIITHANSVCRHGRTFVRLFICSITQNEWFQHVQTCYREWSWDILQVTWFGDWKVKVMVGVRVQKYCVGLISICSLL